MLRGRKLRGNLWVSESLNMASVENVASVVGTGGIRGMVRWMRMLLLLMRLKKVQGTDQPLD